ncbi:SRPBCC family protein [Planotetraspora sp. A-T 1434]|uniref:SRPBCC family protein n=1 Tax=Planotetraspora sp. A-T 1434 TaxID=2979219 RepID=UPI0021C1F3BE|nr:SRPBCC family protein [Planotetraspora sp. A-T 1434]MCT9934114.1 SRPBCC family protein [Planotetraspora sp. A-T 1434]
MSEFERSRRMPASAERVFDVACDVDRLDLWLPRDIHVRPDDLPAVTVHEDDTGRDARGLLNEERDQLRMEWGTRDDNRYAGWLQVAGIHDESSDVTVHLSFFEEEHVPPAEVLDKALDESLERLEEQVRQARGAG